MIGIGVSNRQKGSRVPQGHTLGFQSWFSFLIGSLKPVAQNQDVLYLICPLFGLFCCAMFITKLKPIS